MEVGLGKSISANTVYEGGDVYFDCRVEARPPAHRITWIHNVSVFTRKHSTPVSRLVLESIDALLSDREKMEFTK